MDQDAPRSPIPPSSDPGLGLDAWLLSGGRPAESQMLAGVASVLDASMAAVLVLRAILDEDGRAVDFEYMLVTRGAEKVIRRHADELVGQRLSTIIGDTDARLDHYARVVETGEPFDVEAPDNSGPDERWISLHVRRLESESEVGLVIALHDITEHREMASIIEDLRAKQREMERQALHDPLTGLANRLAILARLEHGIDRLDRLDRSLAVMFLDVDGLKQINDLHGHETGDALLCEIGHRLAGVSRRSDTAGRLGGDEFVIVCEELRDEREVDGIARRFSEVFAEPFLLDGRQLSVGVSLGVVVTSSSDADAASLIHAADIAMYRAKATGGARIAYADAELGRRQRDRRTLETGLRDAIDHDTVPINFEPMIRAIGKDVVGVTAAPRWPDQRNWPATDHSLADAAANLGAEVLLGEHLVDRALQQAMRSRHGSRPTDTGFVVVHIAGQVFHDGDFVDHVCDSLDRHPVGASALCLAVDHSFLVDNVASLIAPFSALDSLGVRFATDNVGAPGSPLVYIDRLPLHYVRLHSGLVADLDDHRRRALVSRIHDAVQLDDRTVIAPGVSTAEQAATLASIGGDIVMHGPNVTETAAANSPR